MGEVIGWTIIILSWVIWIPLLLGSYGLWLWPGRRR